MVERHFAEAIGKARHIGAVRPGKKPGNQS
jgi:hypothetical protein